MWVGAKWKGGTGGVCAVWRQNEKQEGMRGDSRQGTMGVGNAETRPEVSETPKVMISLTPASSVG